jgi:cysteine synthase A
MQAVLVVEEGPGVSKLPFLERMVDSKFEIVLLKNRPSLGTQSEWYQNVLPADKVIEVSFRRPIDVITAVSAYQSRTGITFCGVTTYMEYAVPLVQYLADHLSVPPITSKDPAVLRNKFRMRKALRGCGVPQPRSRLCESRYEACDAVRDIGTPCVIKPVEFFGSEGVQRINVFEPAVIHAAYDHAATVDYPDEYLRYEYNLSPAVVVEEFIPTIQEVSVEGAVTSRVVELVAVTQKTTSALPECEFAETAHRVGYSLVGEDQVAIWSNLQSAADELGLVNTAFHAEFRLREGAPPVLIEIGARLAGGLIPHLVEAATGVVFMKDLTRSELSE